MLLYDGATPESRSKCLWTYKIHHQVKYQCLNANTLYVATILFSRSSLHRESLPCLPNNQTIEIKNIFSTIQKTEYTMRWTANKKQYPKSIAHRSNRMDQQSTNKQSNIDSQTSITLHTADSKHNHAQNTVTLHETACTNNTYTIKSRPAAKQTPLNWRRGLTKNTRCPGELGTRNETVLNSSRAKNSDKSQATCHMPTDIGL